MSLKSFRDTLVRIFSVKECRDNKLDISSAPSEQGRLLHRLNCINLDDEESKTLQAYLTTILEARHQEKGCNSPAKEQSGCIVLEMGEPELREFASCIGENVVRSFRAVVQSDKKQNEPRKLAILGDNGLRIFQVSLQSSDRFIQQ
ncbi:MAG: hypothetical protein KME25_18510 [Symplocastrum torsivum CPER-KK1]|jgi:hypothetical protein|uniref:Uncharacterized protein n=1 Tax=Symplocastrum torsivum CPER-KK1 TaxID=450513 RepID=A0A951PNJ5_9CYAN|nr:hypothetical protein [Symplocastrum torsivum CPER-KK1]